MSEVKWHMMSVDETAGVLKTDLNEGITHDEAILRQAKFGLNKIESKKKKTFLQRFLHQFKDFMIIVLIIAALISGVIGVIQGEGVFDSLVIMVIVIFNAIFGAVQESKAEKSLDALQKLSAHAAKVIRGGRLEVLPSEQLVPGDVIELETGDFVPADLRITSAINMKTQESSLTGESEAVEKHADTIIEEDIGIGDRLNMLFSSSMITYGRGCGVVVETGMNTEIGKIAGIINTAIENETPLQQKLNRLGKTLGLGVLAICAVIFAIGLFRAGFARDKVAALFMSAVSLAVAAIPEGLPAVATIVLAFGVMRMVKRHAIVKNLPSVETLGSATVICSDKTGTLTQNKMTVEQIYFSGNLVDINSINEVGHDLNYLVHTAVLCNDSKLSEGEIKSVTGDPTETALVDMGLKLGINKNELKRHRVDEIPFDSDRKLMTTVHKFEGKFIVYTKGAADELLKRCSRILVNSTVSEIGSDHVDEIHKNNRLMAENALRVLGMAFKELDHKPSKEEMTTIESDLIFSGMVGMIDPPRPECKIAVQKCREAGIKPVMITGDHKITAMAIARELGILVNGSEALTGAELEKIPDKILAETIMNYSVYARVSPEHKVRIVKAWQANGDIVAMTGDGVNDAPALKTADIGLAMGIVGTDVAKQAADVVLTDDNFATIVTAVEEGRRIYDNIIKAIQFLLSSNIGEVIVLFIATLAGWAPPLLPIQILWVNLVTDSLPALALSFEPADKNIMKVMPNRSRGLFTAVLLWRIIYQGLMIGGLTLVAYRIGLATSEVVGQEMAFTVLAFSELVHVFNVRIRGSVFTHNIFANGMLLPAVLASSGLMFLVLLTPGLNSIFGVSGLPTANLLEIIGLSLAPIPIVELFKLFRADGRAKK